MTTPFLASADPNPPTGTDPDGDAWTLTEAEDALIAHLARACELLDQRLSCGRAPATETT